VHGMRTEAFQSSFRPVRGGSLLIPGTPRSGTTASAQGAYVRVPTTKGLNGCPDACAEALRGLQSSAALATLAIRPRLHLIPNRDQYKY